MVDYGLIGGSTSRLQSLTYMHKNTLLAIVIAFMITIFVAIGIALIWGLSALVALFFFALAGTVVLLNRGKFLDYEVILFAAIGIFFIFLSMAGITITTVDFSTVQNFVELHQMIQGV